MWRSLFLSLMWMAVPAFAQHDEPRHPSAKPQPELRSDLAFARFKQEMNTGMTTMMKRMHAPGYTGNPDVDFLAMMIPHHEGAVEMARLALVYGRDPATRRLAEDIIASQMVEIEGMKRRLEALRGNDRTRSDQFLELGGIRGPAK